ncbi:MAG: adenylate/guanylate cyclase domain-containing protein [Erythrobacter sp.]
MIGRFDDPAVEKAYVSQERLERIPATRFLSGIAIVTLISYIAFNPMHFSIEGVLQYNLAAGPFILLLAGLVGLTFTKFYIEKPWVDPIIFSALLVVMLMLIEALGAQSDVTNISRLSMAVINLGIMMVFASVGFVATTRLFLIWAAALVIMYALFLLQADRGLVSKVYAFTNFTTFFTFGCFVNWDIDRRARKTFAAQMALEGERAKTETMLYNVLPEDVAQRLQKGEVIADSFADVSVVFVDIVGFSRLSSVLSPGQLLKMLNTIFGFADERAKLFAIEKVKTVGDAYLAVAGGNSSKDIGPVATIRFSQALIEDVKAYADKSGIDVAVRVGIHTGNVVGGVVGAQRLAYDYWGSTMNIASRLEGQAAPNGIAVSESTYLGAFSHVEFSEVEFLSLKGIGERKVYRVIGMKERVKASDGQIA